MRVYDYVCEEGHKHEHFVADADVATVECKTCGKPAARCVAAPQFKLEPFTGAFPGAADKWVRTRDERMKQERKHKADHGTEWIGQNA